MRSQKLLFFAILMILPSFLFAQTKYIIQDQSVCGDTFSIDVELIYSGTLTATDFAVFWNSSELEYLDSTILVPITNGSFIFEIEDSLTYLLGYNNLNVTDTTGIVRMRFRRLNSSVSSSFIDFKDANPPTKITDETLVSMSVPGEGGLITFDDFSYEDCPSDITVDNDLDECGAVVNWTPPTLIDCDGTGNESSTHMPGDFFDDGTTQVTYSATNGNGETATCVFNVTVNDTLAPTVECPMDTTVVADISGTIIVEDIGPTMSFDNCPGSSITYQISAPTSSSGIGDASGETFSVGNNTVTYTITDASGNESTCQFEVIVEPFSQEVIINFVPTEPIECSSDTISFDVVIEEEVELRTLTFSPNWNSSDLRLISVDPIDAPNPIGASYSGITNGMADIAGQMGYFWQGGTGSFVFPAGYVFFNVTFEVLDNSDNTSIVCGTDPNNPEAKDVNLFDVPLECIEYVIDFENDDTPPMVQFCPQNITAFADDNCMAIVNYSTPLFEDNCDGMDLTGTLTSGFSSGSSFNAGTTAIRYEYEDEAGNGPAVCAFTVTVLDTIAPEVTCMDATIYLDESGIAVIDSADVVSGVDDNCPTPFVSQIIPNSFSCEDIGSNTVEVIISDNNMNFDTCTATVTVLDTVPPVAECQNITINLDADGNASITEEDVDGGSNDNCDSIQLDINITDFDCSNLGDNDVELTVTDSSGNSASCTAIVTVRDTLLFVDCKDIIVELDSDGMATIAEDSIFLDGGKACAGANLTFDTDTTEFTCDDIGANILTLTVEDTDGNTATCMATATVIENEPPMANCLSPVTLYLDDNGTVSIAEDFLDNGSVDNCAIDSFDTDITLFTCNELGNNNMVTMTVFDASGNSDECTSQVRVRDTVPPTASCRNLTVYVGEDGQAIIEPEDIDVQSTDNCMVDSLALSDDVFDCNDVGIVQNIFLYAFDQSGNRDSCLSGITVRDSILPNIICPDDILMFITGTSEVINDIAPLFVDDNCSVDEIRYNITGATSGSGFDDASGTSFNLGISIVTYIVEDDSGNIDSCNFEIDLREQPNMPVIDCPDDIGPLDNDLDQCDAVVDDIELFVFTPPGFILDSVTWSLLGSTNGTGTGDLSGTRFNVGTTRVTYTAHFDDGTTQSCEFLITVDDTQDPVIIEDLRDTTLYATPDNCEIDYTWDDPVVTDNCPIDSLRYNIVGRPNTPSSTFGLGMDTVVYEITDLGGNEITTSFIVTVLDTINPEIVCPPDTTIIVDASVTDTVVNNLTWLSSFDNCGIDDIFYSLRGATNGNSAVGDSVDASGERFNFGTTVVTYYITDDTGNIDSCSFNVRVNTFEFPDFTCPNDTTLYLDGDCMAGIDSLPADANLNEFDTVYHILRGAVADTGVNFIGNRTYPEGLTSITYYYGLNNELDSCSFDVTVTDSLPPIVLCPSFGDTLIIVPEGTTDTIVNSLSPIEISDNCGLEGAYYLLTGSTSAVSDTSLTPDASGESFNLGITRVSYIAYDSTGNVDSCFFNVEIVEQMVDIVCPADTTIFTSDSTCFGSSNRLAPSFTDMSYVPQSFISILSGATTDTIFGSVDGSVEFNLGITNVEYLSVLNNDTLRCDFDVTVLDTIAPNVICQDNESILAPSIQDRYPYSDYSVDITDNCGVDSSYYILTRGDGTVERAPTDSINIQLSRGVNEILTIASDGSGNMDSCTQLISVAGFECPENAVFNNEPGLCAGITENLDLSYDPDSLIADVFYTVTGDTNYVVNEPGIDDTASGDTLPVGNFEVTYTVISTGGDSATCTSFIRVLDTEAPQFVNCPSEIIEIESTLTGCGALFNIATPMATDNCSIDTIIGNFSVGDTLQVGFNTIEFIAFDEAGLTDTCTFVVEVLERDLEIICPDSIVLDIYGNIISDPGNLVTSVNSQNCDSIQIFFEGPQAFVDCIDTTASVSDVSKFESGDIFTVGNNIVIFEVGDTSNNIRCEVEFQVIVPDGPEIVQDSFALCEGDDLLIQTEVPNNLAYNYEWIFQDSIAGQDDSLFIGSVNPDQSGWYYLTSTTSIGCTYMDSAFVTVLPIPEADILSTFQGCLNTGDSLALCAIPLVSSGTLQYQWITPTDTIIGDSCIIIDSVTASDLGTYILTIENELGCSYTDSTSIDTANMLETPLIFASDTTVCAGTSISLGTNPYPFDSIEYVWIVDSMELSGLPENTNTFFFPSVIPQGDSVNYRLLVRTTDGCASDTSELTIFINESPEISGNTNAPIVCASDSDTLFLNGLQLDTLTDIETWIWRGPNGFIDSVQNSFIHPVDDTLSGRYNLTAIASNGCTSETLVEVIVSDSFPDFELFAGTDTICLGSELQIFSSFVADGFEYIWMQSDLTGGLPINADSSNITVRPIVAGDFSYSLVISRDSCISDTVSLDVHVLNAPSLAPINNGPFFCLQSDTTLILQDTVLEAVSYLWTAPDGMTFDSSYVEIDSAGVEDAGIYTLTVIGENGCIATDSTEVLILDSLPQPIIAGDSIYCENDIITLSIQNPIEGAMYDWNGPGGFVDTGSEVTIADAKPSNEGAYNVIASLENCTSELSDAFFITDVLEAPIATDTTFIISIDSSLTESIPIGNYNGGLIYDITILTQPEQGVITISQGPEGLIIEYLPSGEGTGTDIISYSICPSDCPDLCDDINSQGTIEISIIQSECTVNNVITPDNDGFNDELIIDCLEGGGVDLFPDNELIILNQWGDEIFRAAPYQNNWNGTYEGNPVPDGTYFYIFKEGTGVPLQKGFITVFR